MVSLIPADQGPLSPCFAEDWHGLERPSTTENLHLMKFVTSSSADLVLEEQMLQPPLCISISHYVIHADVHSCWRWWGTRKAKKNLTTMHAFRNRSDRLSARRSRPLGEFSCCRCSWNENNDNFHFLEKSTRRSLFPECWGDRGGRWPQWTPTRTLKSQAALSVCVSVYVKCIRKFGVIACSRHLVRRRVLGYRKLN